MNDMFANPPPSPNTGQATWAANKRGKFGAGQFGDDNNPTAWLRPPRCRIGAPLKPSSGIILQVCARTRENNEGGGYRADDGDEVFDEPGETAADL